MRKPLDAGNNGRGKTGTAMRYMAATRTSTFAPMSAVGPDQQAARAEKLETAKRDARDEIDELLWLMSDPRGRRWIWRRLGEVGVYRQSLVPGDFAGTAFNEGQRSVGLKLINQITQHCPGRFTEMQKEAKRHERSSSTSK